MLPGAQGHRYTDFSAIRRRGQPGIRRFRHMADSLTNSGSARLSTVSAGRRRAMRHGLIALAIGWLAWFYWFSRAALVAIVSLAVAFILFIALRSTYRVLRAGSGVYRHLCLRLLLLLARRIV